MNKYNLVHDAIHTVCAVPNNANIYLLGILLNDIELQNHMKLLAHIQAIVMQSLQVNNQKRALKYTMAFYKLSKNNVSAENRLKQSITSKLNRIAL